MHSETKEIWIGAVTVTALVAVLVLMNQGRDAISKAASGATDVIARFNKVDGLVEGSEVRMGGVRIGTVSAMTMDDHYRAVVNLELDPTIPYPSDTSAAIHTDGLFGGKFVVLEPGAEEETLKSGDEITLTQDAVVVSDLLELIIAEGKSAQARRQNESAPAN